MLNFDNVFISLCSAIGKLFMSDFAGFNSVLYGFFILALLIGLALSYLLGGGKRVR